MGPLGKSAVLFHPRSSFCSQVSKQHGDNLFYWALCVWKSDTSTEKISKTRHFTIHNVEDIEGIGNGFELPGGFQQQATRAQVGRRPLSIWIILKMFPFQFSQTFLNWVLYFYPIIFCVLNLCWISHELLNFRSGNFFPALFHFTIIRSSREVSRYAPRVSPTCRCVWTKLGKMSCLNNSHKHHCTNISLMLCSSGVL